MRAIHPLRAMTPGEEQAVQHTAKATSERIDVVKRAQALLAVRAGQIYTQAAREAGYKSGDSVSQLVERFNQQGLAALHIAGGRGGQSPYTATQRGGLPQELQRGPARPADGTATPARKTPGRAPRPEAPWPGSCR